MRKVHQLCVCAGVCLNAIFCDVGILFSRYITILLTLVTRSLFSNEFGFVCSSLFHGCLTVPFCPIGPICPWVAGSILVRGGWRLAPTAGTRPFAWQQHDRTVEWCWSLGHDRFGSRWGGGGPRVVAQDARSGPSPCWWTQRVRSELQNH